MVDNNEQQPPTPKSRDLIVNGIVSARDQKAYVQLLDENGKPLFQLSMSETRQVAMDMLIMASRCEMDSMLIRFTKDKGLGEDAGGMLLVDFREYRAEYDREQAERPPDQEGGLPSRQT